MKKLLTFLLILNFSCSFGQVDSVFMTTKQFNKFQLIKTELDDMLLSDEQVYQQEAQFDSLIEVAENFERNNEFENSARIYHQAKSIYKYSCLIAFKENPLMCGCIFSKDGSSKMESRLISDLELMRTLRKKNDHGLSHEEINKIYNNLINNYLHTFSYLPKFYNANLDSRIWISKYIENLKNVIIIIEEKN